MSHRTTYKKLWLRFGLAVLLLAGFSVVAVKADASLETNYASLGTLLVTPFVAAPFPHPARAAGHTYQDQFYSAAEHYADRTVAVFIPKNFRPTDPVDFVIYFHGWNNTVAGALAQFGLVEQFCASRKNAILVVPAGPRNAPDSFGGKLEEVDGFQKFMDEVMATLRAKNIFGSTNCSVGKIILAGHSGGYHVMAAIVNHSGVAAHIREVWLFDALYGGTENFVAWQKRENGRLLDIYTDHGGTKGESEKMMAFYQTNGVNYLAAEDNAAPWQHLRTNQLVFLHTDLVHDDVVARRGTFGQFLKSSCLENQ